MGVERQNKLKSMSDLLKFRKMRHSLKTATLMPEQNSCGQKICPFTGGPCDPNCKLYRPDKKDYECYFMELQSATWLMTEIKKLLQKMTS
jgi:hypothetical protein